ncbi:MAG TPA: hypothetical protein VFH64_09545 [Amnibacterium sp.]|nr:hypothetical protein [Amnibacterium sp.]
MSAHPHADAPVARGRRRESSRHRTSRSFWLPGWFAWLLRSGTPLVSLLPAVIAVVLVQSLSPAAQRLPAGGARFALAGAWATTAPGAVVGYRHWFTTPVIGWLQLGALDRALLGGTAQSVLAAAHGAMLVLTLACVVLLWFVLRRAGASGLAAGAASAAFGIAPIAIAVHTVVAPVAVALVWLLVSALLVLGRRGPVAAVAIGASAGAAVLSDPVALAVLPALAWVLVAPAVRGPRTLRAVGGAPRSAARPAIAAAAGFAVAILGGALVAVVLTVQQPGDAARTADAIGAAAAAQASFPAAGAASAVAWLRTDPLSLLIGVVAVILAVRSRSFVPVASVVGLVALVSFWPDGADAVGPVVLLLPLLTFATALVIDGAVVALGRPRFLISAIGSGWLMAVVALLVVASVVWIASLRSLQIGAHQPLSRAERWVDSAVEPGQVVLVDLGMWPDLSHGAAATVGWYAAAAGRPAPSSAPWSSADYLVTTGDALGASTGAAKQALARSLAVARFGSGSGAVEIRAVRATPPAAPAPAPPTPAEQRAAVARRQTGGELAANPRLTVDGADRALLQAGDVDSRVSIVLGQLLAVHRLTVGGFPPVPGDSGGVRRQVLISAVDGHPVPHDADATGTILRYLSALRGEYSTSAIDATDAGVLATFAADPTFVPPS